MTRAELKDNSHTMRTDRPLIAGRYLTHARIGSGRLGEIFTATDEGGGEHADGQSLAIQIIPESIVSNNKLFNSFNVGYGRLRACANPNIVSYLQFGRYGKRGFLVMELLDGASLRAILNGAQILPLDEAKPVIYGIGEALRLLHAEDMVHGNLTTKNVFITEGLEVRLLDVLPVDPAEPIIRGAVTSDPFSRCTVENDVFGLACLAYEMLAGKHPFDFCPLAEARLAGLEADRIVSLTDGEWGALRLALSLDPAQRTSTVVEFMRDFGIRGAEHLQPSADQPARHEHIVYPAMDETLQITQPTVPVRRTVTAQPVEVIETPVVADPINIDESSPPAVRQIRKRAGPQRAVFLGMLLAALGAWFYFGQPQGQIESLISYIDAKRDTPITSQSDVAEQSPMQNPAESVSTDVVAPVDVLAVDDAPVDDTPVADTPVDDAPVDNLAVDDAPLADAAIDNPAAVPATSDEEKLADSDAKNSELDAAAAIDTEFAALAQATDQLQADARVGFAEPVVSVSERGGAARVVLVHIDKSAMPLIWWTSEHSAGADTDFISVEQRTVVDGATEDGNVLHIPLVNDGLPEPRESFFVSIGVQHPQQGRIERIDTVRVDIIDDD